MRRASGERLRADFDLRRAAPARLGFACAFRLAELAVEVDVRSAAVSRMPPFFAFAPLGASKRGSTRFLDGFFLEDPNATLNTRARTSGFA
ncbi:MAG: hypothetical protein AAF737_09400 [Pseudomonadota bacterium]